MILYYIPDTKKEKQVKDLCRKLQIPTRALKGIDLNMEIGILAGLGGRAGKEHGKAPEGYPLPEVLIFSGFPDELLESFLTEYKKAGIAPIGLKAVLTVHNRTWTLYELTLELMKERMAIMMGRKG